MSQTKAQLIQPIGVVTASGVVVSGVMTAGTFDGDVVGSATSIIQGTNLNLGAFNATSFAGDFTGNATGIITSSAIKVGQLTASSFVGDFTGTATSMARGTGFEAGAVTGSAFVSDVTGNVTGNATGLAGSVTQGTNIHVGVITATSLYGDGSNMTGIAATNYNTQTVAAVGAATTIDLSAGNMITFNQNANTTVSLANTSEAMDITLIRPGGDRSIAISYATGAVTIAGDDDYISIPASSEYDIGTGDFTVECWMYADTLTSSGHSKRLWEVGASLADSLCIRIDSAGNAAVSVDNSSVVYSGDGGVSIEEWTHVAVCRKSSVMTLYINGEIPSSNATATVTTDIDKSADTFFIGANHADSSTSSWNGEISNFRYVKGTAVYTEAFLPPSSDLTNITNTKILCCQSTSSATAAAVTPGTLTVNGTVTAGAATVSLAAASYPTKGTITWPSSVKWNGGSDPTLNNEAYTNDFNQFQLLTRDSGVTWYGWENAEFVGGSQLWLWGNNDTGQLGQNDKTNYSSPIQMGGSASWKALMTNTGGPASNSGGATKSDGTMWVWGSNTYGKFGLNNQGNPTNRSSPIQLPGTTWSCAIDKFSAGPSSRLAVKTDGTLWSWGYNRIGGLGLNNNGVAYSSPTQVGTDTTWSICNKDEHAGAIKTDGTLWVWGTNKRGCLGQNNQGSHPTYPTAQSSPVQVGTGTNWKYVDIGYNYTFATKTDGTFWSWGYNAQGQLGVSDTTSRSSPVQVPGTNWNKAYCIGGAFTGGGMATKTDGTLWAWGTNNMGRLGLNSETAYSSPKQVPGTTWSYIVRPASLYSIGALKTDGTIWAWGQNTYGHLGQNNFTNYSSPTQVGTDTDWTSMTSTGTDMFALK